MYFGFGMDFALKNIVKYRKSDNGQADQCEDNPHKYRRGGPCRQKKQFLPPVDDLNILQYFDGATKNQLFGIKVARLYEKQNMPVMKNNPRHPDAKDNFNVAMHNIYLMEEMVNMISTTRAIRPKPQPLKPPKIWPEKHWK